MLLSVLIVLPYGTNTICVTQNKLEIYNHDSDAKQTGRGRQYRRSFSDVF